MRLFRHLLMDLPKDLDRDLPKRECARELGGGARTHPLEDTKPEVTLCHLGTEPSEAVAAEAAAPAARTGWEDVDAAFELIPEAEKPSWIERAKQGLRDQGTPWLEACVPVVRSMAFRLWGLGIPVYPETMTTG